MQTIGKYIRSLLFTLPSIALTTIVLSIGSIITSLFDPTGNTQHNMARFWSRVLLRIAFVHVQQDGLEKLDPAQNYVFVANHSSYFDTPAILASIPLQFRFFAKKGLFQIPFLGTHLTRAGHFPVVRDDPRASLKTMAEGARQIGERHISVLLFPEGGRSEHTLRSFKEGAAFIAIRSGVPIVPVGVVGARKVMAMHNIHILPGTIGLRIGDPIPTTGMTTRDRESLTRLLTARVAELIGEPVPEPAA